METTMLTAFSREELKSLMREVLTEILGEGVFKKTENRSGYMSIKEAAEFLKLRITTLYEKTSKRAIPYIKRGGKLYFIREQLENWLMRGKVKTADEIESEAETQLVAKKGFNK